MKVKSGRKTAANPVACASVIKKNLLIASAGRCTWILSGWYLTNDYSLFQPCCTWRRTTWPSWTRTPSGGWGSWGGFTSMTTRSDRWVNDDDGVNDDDDDVGLPSKCPPTIFLLRNDKARLRIFLHRLLSSSWLEAVAEWRVLKNPWHKLWCCFFQVALLK